MLHAEQGPAVDASLTPPTHLGSHQYYIVADELPFNHIETQQIDAGPRPGFRHVILDPSLKQCQRGAAGNGHRASLARDQRDGARDRSTLAVAANDYLNSRRALQHILEPVEPVRRSCVPAWLIEMSAIGAPDNRHGVVHQRSGEADAKSHGPRPVTPGKQREVGYVAQIGPASAYGLRKIDARRLRPGKGVTPVPLLPDTHGLTTEAMHRAHGSQPIATIVERRHRGMDFSHPIKFAGDMVDQRRRHRRYERGAGYDQAAAGLGSATKRAHAVHVGMAAGNIHIVHATRGASLCHRVATGDKWTAGINDGKHLAQSATERGDIIDIHRYHIGADVFGKFSYSPRSARADDAVDIGVRRKRRADVSAARVISQYQDSPAHSRLSYQTIVQGSRPTAARVNNEQWQAKRDAFKSYALATPAVQPLRNG